MSTPETSQEEHPLTDGETAWLIKTLWSSLQAPGWNNKNRKDLEKLGEALYSGKSLKELDDALYDRLFPHLKKVATCLGIAIKNGPPTEETKTAAQGQQPSAPVLVSSNSGEG